MRSLIKAINGGRPFLVDYNIAEQHLEITKKHGFTDLLSQLFGEAPKPYKVAGNIHVIPVYGMIGRNLSPLEAIGATDVNTVDDWIDDAMAQKPDAIVFDINSDGGTVDGVEELANKIRGLGVPTVAFSAGSMNSAAYWIGSASDRVVVSPSASVGSVGVYMTFQDMSAMADAQGIKVVVIKSGEHKGAGIAGTSLTETQHAYFQKEVNDLADAFKASVRIKRSMVSDEDMQGQAMSGKEAAKRFLATGMADSLKSFLKTMSVKTLANGGMNNAI